MRAQTNPVLDYITRQFTHEDALLRQIREMGEGLRPGMQVSPLEGQMLRTFIEMRGAQRILEIGTFVGYSTICMARGLSGSGIIITCESNPEHAAIAYGFFERSGLSSQIDLIEGDAKETIAALEGPFDAVFIDADKAGYKTYLDLVIPKLSYNALIMGDNSLLFGAMAGEQPPIKVSAAARASMTVFNDTLANDELFTSILIPTEEGLTIAVYHPPR